MASIALDFFKVKGQDYLVLVDRFSGYAWTFQMKSTTTQATIKILKAVFLDFGYPVLMTSDGGPQFRETNEALSESCKDNHIVHKISSAYYARSNGLAEAAVKQCRHLLEKSHCDWKTFQANLLEYRNLRRADGTSPAEMFFGRRLRSQLPTLPSHLDFSPEIVSTGAERRSATAEKQKQQHDKMAKDLPPLFKGQRVLIQNPHSLRWEQSGQIIEVREKNRSFYIESDPGKPPILRNQRFLRPDETAQHDDDNIIIAKNEAAPNPSAKRKPRNIKKTPTPGAPVRRSTRLAGKKKD